MAATRPNDHSDPGAKAARVFFVEGFGPGLVPVTECVARPYATGSQVHGFDKPKQAQMRRIKAVERPLDARDAGVEL